VCVCRACADVFAQLLFHPRIHFPTGTGQVMVGLTAEDHLGAGTGGVGGVFELVSDGT
jgi:hypothetical protein